MIMKLQD